MCTSRQSVADLVKFLCLSVFFLLFSVWLSINQFLPLCLAVCLTVCLSVCWFFFQTYPSICVCMPIFVYFSIPIYHFYFPFSSICPCVYLSCLSASFFLFSVLLSICLSVCLSISVFSLVAFSIYISTHMSI